MTPDAASEQVRILTRQYAKRQRTWLRSKMGGWKWIDPQD
jgi:tRNA dimethylallyltransferase